MRPIHLESIIVFLFMLSLPAAAQTAKCDKIHNGSFYFYSAKPSSGFLIVRQGSSQEEIDLNTKDTSFWKAQWQESCVLHMQFLRTTKAIPEDQSIFLKSHTTVIEIQKVTDKYYIFWGSVDVNGTKMGQTQDTVWFKPKMH